MGKLLVYAAVIVAVGLGVNKAITELFHVAGVNPATATATMAPADRVQKQN